MIIIIIIITIIIIIIMIIIMIIIIMIIMIIIIIIIIIGTTSSTWSGRSPDRVVPRDRPGGGPETAQMGPGLAGARNGPKWIVLNKKT